MTQIHTHPLFQSLTDHQRDILDKFTTSDISAEKILDEIIRYYENVIAVMPGNVYWLNQHCITMGCNQNVLDMLGLSSREQFRGLTFDDMSRLGKWSAQAKESFQQDSEEVIKTGSPKINVEEPPIYHKDGRILYFLTSRVPLFDPNGKVIGIVGISIDITERKKIEQQLVLAKEKAEDANKAKTIFLENMRHDIRTPLIGITGFANLIAQQSTDPKIKEYADNLSSSSEALLDLLNEILDIIKINSGEIPLIKKKFDLKKRCEAIIQLSQAKAYQKNISLSFDFDKKIPTYVIGDPTRIHRIVLELIGNALNFTPPDGKVILKIVLAKTQNSELILKIIVTDTGIGIPLEKQQEIFLQFKRLTPSYEGIYKGAGLGLSITKKFLDDIQGEIYVESTIGQGTTFTCVIPLQKPLLENDDLGCEDFVPNKISLLDSKPRKQKKSSQKRLPQSSSVSNFLNKILLVEDQPVAALVAHEMLCEQSCEVDIAKDGNTALGLAKKNHYDLILMDIGLPDISGYEVTQQIRQYEQTSSSQTPIIALSSHVEEENKKKCLQIGMNAVITKPLTKEKARDILKAFIPNHIQTSSSLGTDIPSLPENAIDYETAEKQLGCTRTMIIDLLKMLINEFPQERQTMNKAHKNQDWETIATIAHKIKGGASYCGAIRLQLVCGYFQNCINTKKVEDYEKVYQSILDEMDNIAKAAHREVE
ncbi:MAG: response regulator [Gammaproteobacteria bacterium]|nr:response regulator [Gammaproteobacteria bacterium]